MNGDLATQMLHEKLPGAVRRKLEEHGLNGVPVLLSADTNLSLSGEPGQQWVVATGENVAVVADGDQPALVTHVPLAEVSEFRAQGTIGSGFLQAYVGDHWTDLARYSNGSAARFHRLARRLEELRSTGELQEVADDDDKATHCPKCGGRLLDAGTSCPRCVPRKAILARLGQMLWPHRRTAAAMCGLMLAGVAAELVPPKLQQYLVDDILQHGQAAPEPRDLLAALFAVVLALAVARVLLSAVNFVKGRLATRVGVSLTFGLRAQLVKKLHSLGLHYYDQHQVGALTSRVAYDSEVIQSLLQQVTGGFLLQIVQILAVGVMLFTLNPKLAFLTLLPTPLVVGGSYYFWKRVHPKHYRHWDASSKQAGMLTGMLSGIRVVKAFAQEPREFARFNRSSDYLRRSRVWVDDSTAAFSATMQLVFSLGGLIVWYVGGRDVLQGEMSLGALMAFLAYLAMFYTPLATLSQFTTWSTNFLTGCQRVFELLDTPVTAIEPADPVPLPSAKGRIEFKNVTFGYDRHQPVLRNVSFTIEPGETIGIVGRSGSGKTTVVNLLCRLYDVSEGQILIDGVDVRQLATPQLRRHVGVVLQDPFLFRGTVWDNLVYGQPESTPETAIAAAKAAQAHEFVLRTPLGYDTWLGERGSGLSGGERQRLSIARALLYDPPILVLDEATSNVDTESEQAIQQALRELTRERTTIAIAHRLTTLRDANRILVFDRGKLIEEGTHGALMELDGQYARLVKIQSQVSPKLSVDGVFTHASQNGKTDAATESHAHLTRWLDPSDAHVRAGLRETLEVVLADGSVRRGVFAVDLFPATEPESYISLRTWDRDGQEHEIGILRMLGDWPAEAQRAVRAALARRYYFQKITGVDRIKLEFGHLVLDVRTNHGLQRFTMRWSQSQVHDFGPRGKVLIDLDDNRFLVPDVETLPTKERELFQRYVYW